MTLNIQISLVFICVIIALGYIYSVALAVVPSKTEQFPVHLERSLGASWQRKSAAHTNCSSVYR